MARNRMRANLPRQGQGCAGFRLALPSLRDVRGLTR
ncbi:hypothetical protein GA0074695_6500 [Micromonospora viridifaciens]|uniref:Uncharacterized protein n=1 Tax=Micromonospora viridifaciens TaxID=1881 RepID=A0A1C5A1S5_MICVI|nr:hypothetical protein GA0074695_6500 [Micromonospora viridifaciens]